MGKRERIHMHLLVFAKLSIRRKTNEQARLIASGSRWHTEMRKSAQFCMILISELHSYFIHSRNKLKARCDGRELAEGRGAQLETSPSYTAKLHLKSKANKNK